MHDCAWNCISPLKVISLPAVSVVHLSGVTSNTPTCTLSLSASVFPSCHPICSTSASICLGFLLHSLRGAAWQNQQRVSSSSVADLIFLLSVYKVIFFIFLSMIFKRRKKGNKEGHKISVCERGKGTQRDAVSLCTGVAKSVGQRTNVSMCASY